jgi:hypothetical protein
MSHLYAHCERSRPFGTLKFHGAGVYRIHRQGDNRQSMSRENDQDIIYKMRLDIAKEVSSLGTNPKHKDGGLVLFCVTILRRRAIVVVEV